MSYRTLLHVSVRVTIIRHFFLQQLKKKIAWLWFMRTETCNNVRYDINVLCWTAYFRSFLIRENTKRCMRIKSIIMKLTKTWNQLNTLLFTSVVKSKESNAQLKKTAHKGCVQCKINQRCSNPPAMLQVSNWRLPVGHGTVKGKQNMECSPCSRWRDWS